MPIDRDYLMDVKDEAVAMCVERFEGAMDEIAPDGLSYFDDDFENEADFVMFYLGLRDYSHPTFGEHLDLTRFLPRIAPKLWSEWTNRYYRAVNTRLIGAR